MYTQQKKNFKQNKYDLDYFNPNISLQFSQALSHIDQWKRQLVGFGNQVNQFVMYQDFWNSQQGMSFEKRSVHQYRLCFRDISKIIFREKKTILKVPPFQRRQQQTDHLIRRDLREFYSSEASGVTNQLMILLFSYFSHFHVRPSKPIKKMYLNKNMLQIQKNSRQQSG